MSDQPLTMDEVADIFYDAPGMQRPDRADWFDKALAAHEAAIRADEREKAAQVLIDACLADNQPYEEGLCGHCMVVAAAVRGDGSHE